MVDESQLSDALRRLPETWERGLDESAFTRRVEIALQRREQRRAAVLSLTAAVGGVFAASPLLTVARSEPLIQLAGALLEPWEGLITPQMLLTVLAATVLASVAALVPTRT